MSQKKKKVQVTEENIPVFIELLRFYGYTAEQDEEYILASKNNKTYAIDTKCRNLNENEDNTIPFIRTINNIKEYADKKNAIPCLGYGAIRKNIGLKDYVVVPLVDIEEIVEDTLKNVFAKNKKGPSYKYNYANELPDSKLFHFHYEYKGNIDNSEDDFNQKVMANFFTSKEELRELAMNDKKSVVEKSESLHLSYNRSDKVVAYIRKRATGKCELCKNDAPFKTKEGLPYLEVHHIDWLANGGEDSIFNTVALCPNCHKKMHYGDAEADVEYLKEYVENIEKNN